MIATTQQDNTTLDYSHERPQTTKVGEAFVFDPLYRLAQTNRAGRKYPQFQQSDIFSLQDAFRKLDVDDKGYLDEATVIKATQTSERQPYDVVRQALKEVDLDSSRRVELDDYVDVSNRLSSLRYVKLLLLTAHADFDDS